jgi:RNase H-like domain found in reverse transcriptase
MKALMARDAFVHFPDPNKPYHVYTDASDLQLGSVIMQEGIPIAFYSRKLNPAQRNYTTM